MGRLKIIQEDDSVERVAYLSDVQEVADDVDDLLEDVDDLQSYLAQHKLDYASQRQQDQLKVAKVEKDINDYQSTMASVNVNQEAKQKASGYGIISLPKNAANGQVSDVVVKGLSLKNELNYNRETWEEWTKSTGVTGDSTGLTLTGGNAVASLSTKLKNNTKYVLLYYLLSSDATSFRLNSHYTGSVINLPRIVGNQAISFTTLDNITINALNINTSSDNVGSVKIKDIRLF